MIVPEIIRRWASRIGLDRAVAFTVGSRTWSIIGLPVTMYCVVRCLSREEQGFYFTFDSLLALQVFFDLGVAFVVLQFASHEKAHLNWDSRGRLQGSATAKARLGCLLGKAVKAYLGLAGLLWMTILPAGFWFFSDTAHSPVAWRLAWAWAVTATAGNLLVSPLLAFCEGCGLVAEVARLRLFQQIGGTVTAWIVLASGGKLLAVPAFGTAYFVIAILWLGLARRRFLWDLRPSGTPVPELSWIREVWPLQWRITVSWLSGYFIFHLFNPVLFAFQGAEVAGRMGMTLRIIDAMRTVCLSWITTKTPLFGSLIAHRRFAELDQVFFRNLKQSYLVLLAGCVTLLLGLAALLAAQAPGAQRVLGLGAVAWLLGSALLNHLVSAQAVYLRAHKQEPFVWLSLLGAALCAPTTYFTGRYFGADAVALGYFLITLIFGVTASTYVFQVKRRAWHPAPADSPTA